MTMTSGEGSPTIELVDMCSLQAPDRVDFKKMKDYGVRGVWFKASQYSSSKDPTFDIGVQRATEAGLVAGAYHFAYCGSDPVAQMRFFFEACKGLGSRPGELPAMLDWEYANKGNDGQPITNTASVDWLEAASNELWRLFGRGIIYTYPYFCEEHQPYLGTRLSLGQKDLCLAAYPTITNVPRPWPAVAVQQYVGNGGKVPGVSTDCDRDRFFGTEEQFQHFIGNGAVSGAV